MNIVYLMHFRGIPSLSASASDLRYTALSELMYDNELRNKYMIFSTANEENCYAMINMKRIAKERGVKWHEFDYDEKTDSAGWKHFKDGLDMAGLNEKDVKNIIMCGTNLAGCILKGKETSAINLIKRGFNVVLYLPACAEEEAPGTVSIQKMFHGIEGMYDIIKSQYLIDKLDMAASHNRLSAKFF